MDIKVKKDALRRERKRVLSRKVVSPDIDGSFRICDMMDSFKDMSIQARNLGMCADVFEQMLSDKDRPTILLGLAGPLIAGGLRNIIRGMIEHNMIDVIVSTGAVMYQDIYQGRGFSHYKGSPYADDAKLRDLYIDRIYDTYVDEEQFWETDKWVGRYADTLERRIYSSREFMSLIGRDCITDKKSIVRSAYTHGVPIFIPAINDSSIGIGLTNHYHQMKKKGEDPITISSIRDNYELTQIVAKSKATAAIYIAGGVPKNYINDSVVMTYIFNRDTGGHTYAFQITTAVTADGGLSSSTLDEAKSWGKVNKRADRAMAWVDPMIGLPLVYGSVLQKGTAKKRSRRKIAFTGDMLTTLQ